MSYLGFDMSGFPEIPTIRALKAVGVYWCGAYLVAPSHPNAAWVGKHAAVRGCGVATFPVCVGEELSGPGAHQVTPTMGAAIGASVAAQMHAEGCYAPGSFVALDLEQGGPFLEPRAGYVRAWATAVREAGWGAAVYGSHDICAAVLAMDPTLRFWAFKVPTTQRTIADFTFPSPDLAELGCDAVAWQFRQNVWLPQFDVVVDFDVASTPDPNAP